jgi:hypothetical protein
MTFAHHLRHCKTMNAREWKGKFANKNSLGQKKDKKNISKLP